MGRWTAVVVALAACGGADIDNPLTAPADGPPAGNPDGACDVPDEARPADTFTLSLCGTRVEHNHANEGGGAIFFVSNDRSGSLTLRDSVLCDNPSDGFETAGFPGVFVLAAGDPQVDGGSLSPTCAP